MIFAALDNNPNVSWNRLITASDELVSNRHKIPAAGACLRRARLKPIVQAPPADRLYFTPDLGFIKPLLISHPHWTSPRKFNHHLPNAAWRCGRGRFCCHIEYSSFMTQPIWRPALPLPTDQPLLQTVDCCFAGYRLAGFHRFPVHSDSPFIRSLKPICGFLVQVFYWWFATH